MRRIFLAMAIAERISMRTTTTAGKFYLHFLPSEITKSLALSVWKLWEKKIKTVGESHSEHLAYDFKMKKKSWGSLNSLNFFRFSGLIISHFISLSKSLLKWNGCSNLGRIYKLKICNVIIISTISLFVRIHGFVFVVNWQCPDYLSE